MCLTVVDPKTCRPVKPGEECNPAVADYNMVVYKLGHMFVEQSETFRSQYMGYVYVTGVPAPHMDLRPATPPDSDYDAVFVNEGYHAYVYADPAIFTCPLRFNAGVFVIPEGSEYFLGVAGDIVSSDVTYLMPLVKWNSLNDKERDGMVSAVKKAG